MAQQLVLFEGVSIEFSFDNFVVGRNEELVQMLKTRSGQCRLRLDDSIYIWGDQGSGKTHLLGAYINSIQTKAVRSIFFTRNSEIENFDQDTKPDLVIVDNIDDLSDLAQDVVFRLFNSTKIEGGQFLAAGSKPPTQLKLREDLTTRLGWGLIYRTHGLNDSERAEALRRRSKMLGMKLSEAVLEYLLAHYSRDMTELLSLFQSLESASMESKRTITIPFVKSFLSK